MKGQESEYVKSLKAFFYEIPTSLVIYDPLDRDIPSSNNQALKRKDLLSSIDTMIPTEGS